MQYLTNYMLLVFQSSKWRVVIRKYLFHSSNLQFSSFSKNSNATLSQILPPSKACCYSSWFSLPEVKFTQSKVNAE